MVERPIKKSERQAVTESNDVVEQAPNTESSTTEGAQGSITQSQTESNDVVEQAPNTESSTTEGAQDSNTQSLPERNTTRPLLAKDQKKGKDRRDQRKDEQSSKPPANLALMRGPKPTKPKPPAIKAPQEVTESDSAPEADQEET